MAVVAELERATEGHVTEAVAADAVDRMPARWVASPGSTEELSEVLKVAAAHDLSVVPRGAGTKLTWGTPPTVVDLVIDTTRMDALVEHAVGDLIAVVGAGRLLDDLAADLAPTSQRLGVDPARKGTVGGAVATASSGPLRLHHGAVRDVVIGMTAVRADGVIAHAGGKVVKNVAGYDLGKLLTGSFGTLAVISEVAFRLHPVPEASSWVSVPVDSIASVHRLVQAVVHAQHVPSAVELDRPADDGMTLAVLLEGIAPGVAGRTEGVLELMGAGATASSTPPDWWGEEPTSAAGLIKVTYEIAGLASMLAALDDASAATGVVVHARGSVAVGTAFVGVQHAGTAGELARFVGLLREDAASFGGAVVVLDAPPEAKAAVDPWGPVRGLDLMRSVKRQFDPGRLLAPGRFVGGI